VKKEKPAALKCVIDIRHLPPEAYALPDDGRQGRHLRRQRRTLALQLAMYANPDGTSARPSSFTLAKELGLSRRTVTRLLHDLTERLGFLQNGEIHRLTKVRVRSLNVQKMTGAPAPSSEQPASSSRAPAPSSISPAPSSFGAQPPLTYRPSEPPNPTAPPTMSEPPVSKPEGGWEASFKTKAATLDVFLTRQDMDIIRSLAATEEYGVHFVKRAISGFIDKDLTGVRSARAVFMKELEGRFAKAKHDCLSSSDWRDAHVPGHRERQDALNRRQIIANMVRKTGSGVNRDPRFDAECSAQERELLERLDAGAIDIMTCPLEESEMVMELSERERKWTPPPEDDDYSSLFSPETKP
jgi:hypothetical protein